MTDLRTLLSTHYGRLRPGPQQWPTVDVLRRQLNAADQRGVRFRNERDSAENLVAVMRYEAVRRQRQVDALHRWIEEHEGYEEACAAAVAASDYAWSKAEEVTL